MRSHFLLHLSGGLGNQMFQLCRTADYVGKSRVKVCTHRASTTENILDFGVDESFLTSQGVMIIKKCGWVERIIDLILVSLAFRVRSPKIRNPIKKLLRTNLGEDEGFGSLRTWGYFQNKPPTRAQIEFIKNSLALDKSGNSRFKAGAHFRGGDFNNGTFGVLDRDYYARSFRAIRKAKETSDALTVICSSKDLLAAKSALGDLSRELDYVSHTNARLDFEMLRSFNAVICSNSTFCYWAAATSALSPIVFVPSPSFLNHPDLPYPDEWIRIKSKFSLS